jgi:GcrA cell cycle regulator
MTWTDERVTELGRLWESGYSASAIGRILGVSKNAVVGKAHRLRLQSRPSPIRREGRAPARRRVPMPARPSAPRPVISAPPPEPRWTLRTDPKGRTCLWPLGDPGDEDFHFCAQPAAEGKPYCPAHCARAYITRTRAEDEAA